MKLAYVLGLGLVAGAAAGQVHLKVDTEQELSGSFKADDGTVMHFKSTPGRLQLADSDMEEIWDTDVVPAEPELLQGKEVQGMINRMQDSNEALAAVEFSHALGQTHPGHESPLALQFHVHMMTFAKTNTKKHPDEAKFVQEEEEDEEDPEFAEAKWGRRRRRRRRRFWRRGYGEGNGNFGSPSGEGGVCLKNDVAKCNGGKGKIGMCGGACKCMSWVCGDCQCHGGCKVHDYECCTTTVDCVWNAAKGYLDALTGGNFCRPC